MNSEARKLHVWLLIGSGVVAAAQIGKAIISLPMIRTDLALGLDLAGMTVHHPTAVDKLWRQYPFIPSTVAERRKLFERNTLTPGSLQSGNAVAKERLVLLEE